MSSDLTPEHAGPSAEPVEPIYSVDSTTLTSKHNVLSSSAYEDGMKDYMETVFGGAGLYDYRGDRVGISLQVDGVGVFARAALSAVNATSTEVWSVDIPPTAHRRVYTDRLFAKLGRDTGVTTESGWIEGSLGLAMRTPLMSPTEGRSLAYRAIEKGRYWIGGNVQNGLVFRADTGMFSERHSRTGMQRTHALLGGMIAHGYGDATLVVEPHKDVRPWKAPEGSDEEDTPALEVMIRQVQRLRTIAGSTDYPDQDGNPRRLNVQFSADLGHIVQIAQRDPEYRGLKPGEIANKLIDNGFFSYLVEQISVGAIELNFLADNFRSHEAVSATNMPGIRMVEALVAAGATPHFIYEPGPFAGTPQGRELEATIELMEGLKKAAMLHPSISSTS